MTRNTAPRVAALADLKVIKKAIEAQAIEQARVAKEQALAKKQAAVHRSLFQATVGTVHKIPNTPTAHLAPAPPPPTPRQHLLDEAAALRETLSDEMDVARLLDTNADLSFLRPGVGPDVAQNLRRGKWAVQAQMDLHGLRSDEAREALGQFVRESHRQGLRCVRVIHGKGLGSPGKSPVLKDKVLRWLVQKSEVIAFVQARPAQGGAGALLVLLQAQRGG